MGKSEAGQRGKCNNRRLFLSFLCKVPITFALGRREQSHSLVVISIWICITRKWQRWRTQTSSISPRKIWPVITIFITYRWRKGRFFYPELHLSCKHDSPHSQWSITFPHMQYKMKLHPLVSFWIDSIHCKTTLSSLIGLGTVQIYCFHLQRSSGVGWCLCYIYLGPFFPNISRSWSQKTL